MNKEKIKKESMSRFESRFGNIKEFKKKVNAEHLAEHNDKTGQCLECNNARVEAGLPRIEGKPNLKV